MSENEVIVAVFGMITGTVMFLSLARMIVGRRHVPPPARDPALGAKLEQLQQSIDAVAVEVERISEAQRFTTRLLSEGSADSRPVREGLHRPGERLGS